LIVGESVYQGHAVGIDDPYDFAATGHRGAQDAPLTNLVHAFTAAKFFIGQGVGDQEGSGRSANTSNDGFADHLLGYHKGSF
jgi:hypothetical protein